jgi:hypothetical protein
MVGDHTTGRALDAFDDLTDFLGGLLRALGQVTHLVGHHGETTTLLTRARRFDGGIERQQVGLLGDALDHVQHRTDLFAVDGQGLDLAHRLAHFIGQQADVLAAAFDETPALLG